MFHLTQPTMLMGINYNPNSFRTEKFTVFGFNLIAGKIIATMLLMVIANMLMAQAPLPFQINNTSSFPDTQLFVAIVGEDLTGPPGAHIWVDCKTGAQNPMSPSYNTIQGPVYGGNMGPGGNARYANCFTRLSEIPNKTVMLPPIQGCRVYISQGQQLYFYFFGATGSPRGYTAPSHTDPTDPNQGILYEMIELTYNQFGFFGNPTRVDSYKYPMGLELFGGGGYYKKVGEIKTHAEIGSLFQANVPTEFQGCYKASTGEILAPSKTPAFADGSIGSMPTPGPYVNYMKPYVDQVWAKYAGEDLIFDTGDAGIWRGRVQGEQLVMTAQTGGFTGRRGIIVRRPTTQETFEGKGVLDNVVQDATTDLLIQAQICAALNRRVINVTTPNVGQQNWSQSSTYYSAAPCNYYARFWHLPGISVDQLSYGFAYDDVWNHSPSLHSATPTRVIATFGGFAGSPSNTPPTVSITSPSNNATFTAPANITINATASDANGSVTKVEFYNGTTKLGEDLTSPYTFSWTNVASGTYSLTARATDNGGSTTTSSPISITVTGGTTGLPAPWQTADIGAVAATGSATHSNGTFTLQGSGADIWGTADEFRFVYQTLNGNGSIVARVTSLTNTNAWAKAGVMIRQTLAANSTHAMTVISPTNGIAFQRRTATGGTSVGTTIAGQAIPKYLKIERNGTTFTSSYSTDGITFTTIGTTTITMATSVQIGMCVTSHADGVLTSANFTNVSVTGGSGNSAPTVSITSPSSGATFTTPASITINASASDSDGSVSRVEFFNGSTKLGEDLSSPYSFSWTNVGEGSYSLTARATDNLGLTTTSSAVSVTVSNAPSGFQLVWADEFTSGIGPDWVFETGTGNGGWGNNELQYYLPQNATVSNGQLVITAKRESVGGMQYTSARMKTQGRKSWKYGRVEARIASPSFQGVWPAFWMLGDNFPTVGWPGCGEIDIFEHVNTGNQVFAAMHWIDHNNVNANYSGNTTLSSSISNFHTYRIDWTPSSIKWFVDGIQYHEANILNSINGTNEFHNNFFVILNMAIGGNWPGFTIDNNAFPATMLVDYVRVYQENVNTNTPPTVSITSPSNNATFTAPANVTINATASDANGSVTRVEFFNGSTKLGEDLTSPYTFSWTNVASGTYSLTARATDNGGATTTSSAISITVTGGTTGLPAPWQTADIGAVAATGSATHSNGTFTLQGSGADIWGTADEFRFVYQTLNGNGSIVARVTSLTNTNAWAKAGVMIRESLAANSKHAAMVVTPTSGVSFPRRTETGGTSTSTTIAGQAVPKYVKIERNGTTFTSSYSSDGVNFTTVGTISISMATSVQIGLCLSSHSDGVLASSTFTGVSVTGGSGGGGGVCTGTVPNGDYSYEVSTSGSTVNWKFIPLAPIAGSTLSIIYINGTGFTMTASGSNFVYSSSAYSSGQTLTFYFTYRVGNTTVERNSSATPHTYNVGASCASGASARSVDSGTTAEYSDADAEDLSIEGLHVYPNPVDNELKLRSSGHGAVKILNAQGAEVTGKAVNATTIDVSELPSGVYTVVVIKNNRRAIKRFIKK